MPLGGNVADDDFGRTRGFGGAALVRVADHLVRRGHIHVLGIGGRNECDAIGPVEVLGKDFMFRRGACRAFPEHEHATRAALRQEDVAVRRDAERARLLEPAGEHFHGEAVRHFRQRALRRRDHLHRRGVRLFRLRRFWRRQVRRLDVALNAGGVALPAVERRGAGFHACVLRGRDRSRKCQCQNDRKRRSAHFHSSPLVHRIVPRASCWPAFLRVGMCLDLP